MLKGVCWSICIGLFCFVWSYVGFVIGYVCGEGYCVIGWCRGMRFVIWSVGVRGDSSVVCLFCSGWFRGVVCKEIGLGEREVEGEGEVMGWVS